MMAGGLNPDNVAAAIEQVWPAAVDVHTGLEDRAKVRRFIEQSRAALARLAAEAA